MNSQKKVLTKKTVRVMNSERPGSKLKVNGKTNNKEILENLIKGSSSNLIKQYYKRIGESTENLISLRTATEENAFPKIKSSAATSKERVKPEKLSILNSNNINNKTQKINFFNVNKVNTNGMYAIDSKLNSPEPKATKIAFHGINTSSYKNISNTMNGNAVVNNNVNGTTNNFINLNVNSSSSYGNNVKIIINTKRDNIASNHSLINSNANSHNKERDLASPTSNMNNIYSNLAKQLRDNKRDKPYGEADLIKRKLRDNKFSNDIKRMINISYDFSSIKNKNNDKNDSNKDNKSNKAFLNKTSVRILDSDKEKKEENTLEKEKKEENDKESVKDNKSNLYITNIASNNMSRSSLKASFSRNITHIEADSPEELHYIYVNFNQQNKNLALKFDKAQYNTIKFIDSNMKNEENTVCVVEKEFDL